MNRVTGLFVGAVIAAGAAALLAGAPDGLAQPGLAAAFLGAMLVISLLKLRLPLGLGQSTMSLAYVVDFAVLVTLGVETAMLIAAAGALAQCTINVRRPQPWYRAAFSAAAVILSVQAAGVIWSLAGGAAHVPGVLGTVAPMSAAALGYFLVNSGLVATAVGLSNGAGVLEFWRRNFAVALPLHLLAAVLVSSFV